MKIISKINKSIKILSITSAFCLSLTVPSFALDSNAFIERLQSVMHQSGFKIEPGKVSLSGNTISMDDATILTSDVNEKDPKNKINYHVKNLVFNDVIEDGKGDYSVGNLKANEVAALMENTEPVFVAHNIEVTKLFVTADKTNFNKAAFENASIKKININNEGKSVAVVDDILISYPEYDFNKNIKNTMSVGNISIDVKGLQKPAQEQFTKMGFKTLEMQGNFDTDIDLVSGNANVTLHGNMNDAGQLDINISLGGFTKNILQEFVRLAQQADSGLEDDKKTATIEILGLIQQLSMRSIDVRFDDNSITNKIIDLNKGDKLTREDFVRQIKILLPFGLSQLQDPEFAEKVNTQLGMYLDNPDNLEITAKPKNPAPLAVIGVAAMTSRKQLIDVLNLDIKANQ